MLNPPPPRPPGLEGALEVPRAVLCLPLGLEGVPRGRQPPREVPDGPQVPRELLLQPPHRQLQFPLPGPARGTPAFSLQKMY